MVATSLGLPDHHRRARAPAAFGIANEKKWGYAVAVGGAVLQVVMLVRGASAPRCSPRTVIISFLFDAALVALLLHPMSREYQRIWFK